MKYENRKIVGIISTNVDATTALNVIGHLAIAIGKNSDEEIMGKKIITDKSNINHLGISKFPFIVTKVKPSKLRAAIDKAKEVLPTPGGPTKQRIGLFKLFVFCFTAKYSRILSLTSSRA